MLFLPRKYHSPLHKNPHSFTHSRVRPLKRYCRNCYHPLAYKAKFCAHCGQKDTDGRIGIKNLLGRLWNNTFHLEGKFIRTAWQLFVPGKVTLEFFKGKQDRYPHPIRTFGIVMFLFLFLLNLKLKDKEMNGGNGIAFDGENLEVGEDVAKTSTLSAYERIKNLAMLRDMRHDYETSLPADWKTPQAKYAVDSLMKAFTKRYALGMNGSIDSLLNGPLDSIGFGTGFINGSKGIQIASLDLVRYEPEELIKYYHITHWLDCLLVRQGIKSYKTPEALIHSMIGSLTWAILALVALMSGVLGLLYIRQKHYYVEHFIFLLHFHTGVMLLLLLAIGGNMLGLCDAGVIGVAAILPLPGMYLGLLRYYNQGWLKTFVKWLLYGVLYLFAFTLLFILGMIVVFAVF